MISQHKRMIAVFSIIIDGWFCVDTHRGGPESDRGANRNDADAE